MGLAVRAFFIAAFATIKRWKIVVFFFLVNFLLSAFLAVPLFVSLSREAGHFGGLESFLQHFDPGLLADFGRHSTDLLQGVFLAAGLGGLIYYLLFNLFSGGMISILADPREKTSMKTFLRACGRFSFRFVRLLFYFVLFLAVLACLNSALDKGLLWYFNDFKEAGSSSAALGWTLFAKNILMILLLAYGLISFNYGKTAAVVEDRHFMGSSFLRGMGFALTHPLVTGLFFILATIVVAATVWAYAVLARCVDPGQSYSFLQGLGGVTLSGVLLYLLIAQFIQFFLQAGLVLRHAGQVYIFKYLTVQDARPDPELVSRDPYSPFIPDRPYSGPEDKAVQPGMEEDQDHV